MITNVHVSNCEAASPLPWLSWQMFPQCCSFCHKIKCASLFFTLKSHSSVCQIRILTVKGSDAVNLHYKMLTVDASMCDMRRLATKLGPNEKWFVVTEKQTTYCWNFITDVISGFFKIYWIELIRMCRTTSNIKLIHSVPHQTLFHPGDKPCAAGYDVTARRAYNINGTWGINARHHQH